MTTQPTVTRLKDFLEFAGGKITRKDSFWKNRE